MANYGVNITLKLHITNFADDENLEDPTFDFNEIAMKMLKDGWFRLEDKTYEVLGVEKFLESE